MDPISRVDGTHFAPRTLPTTPAAKPAEAAENFNYMEISDEVSVRALSAQSEGNEEVRKSEKKEKESEKKVPSKTSSSPKVQKFINQVENFYLSSGNLDTTRFKELDLNGPSYPRSEIITLGGHHLAPPKTLLME